MNAPDRRHAAFANHGCQKTWTLMKKAKSQKLKWKATLAAKKLQDAMDDSIEINAPEEVLRPKEKKSGKLDEMTRHKSKSKSDKSAAGDRSGWVQSKLVRMSDSTSRTEKGTDRHHQRSRDEDRHWDRYSNDRGSPIHTSEWWRSPRRHSCDHRHPASSSGRPSERSREWSSMSSTATSTGSRHRDPAG